MEKIFWSKETGGFYPKSIHGDSIPADSVEISRQDYMSLSQNQSIPDGKEIQCGPDGFPVAKEIPPPGVDEMLDRAKAALRTARAPMLDAISGIAGRAARSGNVELSEEADDLAEELLTVTDDPDLNEAKTYEAMVAAGKAFYARLAAKASDPLKAAFREATGA